MLLLIFRLLTITTATLLAVIVVSCGEKEIIEPITPSERKNSKPLPFEVEVLAVSDSYATISWGPVYDIDSDVLQHSIYLENTLIASGLLRDGVYKFKNLVANKSYSGTVMVTDNKTAPYRLTLVSLLRKHFPDLTGCLKAMMATYLPATPLLNPMILGIWLPEMPVPVNIIPARVFTW